MTERTVQIGMATYTDANGARRIGLAGEQVDVQPDDVKRFDELNGAAPPKDTPAPKRRGRPRKA